MNRKEASGSPCRTALISRAADIVWSRFRPAEPGSPQTREIVAALQRLRYCRRAESVSDPRRAAEAVRLCVANLRNGEIDRADQLNVFDLPMPSNWC